MNDNRHLQSAKNAKDDEFYTTYETIESELQHYTRHFRNKTVLCNCDDPLESNFCRFFLRNFNLLKLKRLICTSYAYSKISTEQNDICQANVNGTVLDINRRQIGIGQLTEAGVRWFLRENNIIKPLKGDGDFRSNECIAYLDVADIIVTNPPFSLFKELVFLLHKKKKKYLLIGNQNALTYKEIFPLLQRNQAWTGYRFGDMKFRVPQSSLPRKTRYWVDNAGQKWRSLGNAMWLTNLDNSKRHTWLQLTREYDPRFYPKYDNYDAIHVSKVIDIPNNYFGVMGVPITIVDKLNPEQFEIIGEANHGSDNEFDLFKPTIKGKEVFKRILIRHKRNTANV